MRIKQRASGFDEVHIVFDRYDLPNSLKEATRQRRAANQNQVRFDVSDSTPWLMCL